MCKIFNIRFTTALNILVSLYQTKVIDREKARLMLTKLEKYGRYSKEIAGRVKEDIK